MVGLRNSFFDEFVPGDKDLERSDSHSSQDRKSSL